MQGLEIGEILCRMGIITRDDVSRILVQQSRTRQKFGQIAVRWGLATQDQIWEAWARQFAERERLNLAAAGTDTAAWERVPLKTARHLGVVPLRLWGDHLVVAAPPELPEESLRRLTELSACRVHICQSSDWSISSYLNNLEALSAA